MSVLLNGALNSHVIKRKAVEYGGQRLSCLLFRREVGCFLVNLFPVLQYIDNKSILRTAEIGQSALEHSHSPQLWVAILVMPILSSKVLDSVGFRGQESISWSFSKYRQMLWEESRTFFVSRTASEREMIVFVLWGSFPLLLPRRN